MKDFLSGYKTIVNGWVMAVLPILAMIGIEVDPEMMTSLLEQFWGWIAGGFALLGAANHYFRNLSK